MYTNQSHDYQADLEKPYDPMDINMYTHMYIKLYVYIFDV